MKKNTLNVVYYIVDQFDGVIDYRPKTQEEFEQAMEDPNVFINKTDAMLAAISELTARVSALEKQLKNKNK